MLKQVDAPALNEKTSMLKPLSEKELAFAIAKSNMMNSGGGVSMPVVNNSYSYSNVDNVVTELPTTSLLNMTNALT